MAVTKMTEQFLVMLGDITKMVTRNCGLGGSGCTLGALESMVLLVKTIAALEQVAQICVLVHGHFQDLAGKSCG